MAALPFFRSARRRRVLAERPIADSLWDWALRSHRLFAKLDAGEARRLRELATIFLAEKTFTALGAAAVDDEFKVSVAAQACLPLLGLADDWRAIDWYDDWSTLLITEREYKVAKRDWIGDYAVEEYDDELSGEVFELGPVALSKADVEQSGWGDGYNVVIHEMAHKLDARGGGYDGCPPLRRGMDRGEWRRVFGAAFADLRARLAERRPPRRRHGKLKRGAGPRLDDYAAENPGEFFAVCCEYYFERPALLAAEYPEVFALLVRFFGREHRT
jgi:Mlc titration factor MtfA (ptsG expression regulator)